MKKEEKTIFLKTRRGASLVMVFLVLFSLWLGPHKTFGKMEQNLEDVFQNGVNAEDYDFSIAHCLEDRMTYASNLVTLGTRILGSKDEKVVRVTEGVKQLETAETVSEKAKANDSLSESAAVLYDGILSVLLSSSQTAAAQDIKTLKAVYQDFKSQNDVISHNDYNSYVMEYNHKLGSSPLGAISGYKKAELFQ